MTVGKHHVKEVLSDDLKLSRVGALQMLGGREFQVLAAKVFLFCSKDRRLMFKDCRFRDGVCWWRRSERYLGTGTGVHDVAYRLCISCDGVVEVEWGSI